MDGFFQRIRKNEALFLYLSFAAFSLGIFLQETMLILHALVQLSLGLAFEEKRLDLSGPVKASLVYMGAIIAGAIVAQIRLPIDEGVKVHWATGALWVVTLTVVPKLNWAKLHRFMLIFSIPGLIFSIYWLLQPRMIEWAMSHTFYHYPRAMGFVSSPITNSEGLVVIACWTLSRLSGHLSRKERRWLITHLTVTVLIIVFSRVRAGILELGVISLMMALLNKRLRKIGLILAGLIGAGFLLGILIFGFNTESLAERGMLIRQSLVRIEQYPIFGIGPDRFPYYPVAGDELQTHPHNTILGVLTESGFVGLLGYLVLMAALTFRLAQLYRAYGQDSQLAWVIRALILVFLVYWIGGLTDYNLADTELLILHALHWGLIANLPLPSQEPRPSTTPEPAPGSSQGEVA